MGNHEQRLGQVEYVPLEQSRRFSVAPMMDWTDRHCRYFHRQLTKYALLYTEMVTAQALVHGDPERLLAFHPEEHPVALQLGGSAPDLLAEAVRIAESFGYDEYNLNVGCPSDRVQSGRFGACLMAEPTLVAECVQAMQEVTNRPVTVKTRIGIDHQDSYEFLQTFVETVARAGVRHFIVHARKAWLSGLSPKENREVPPLHYERVYQLKKDFPTYHITINGGITELAQVLSHLQQVDGVMMGRAAYQTPYVLVDVEQHVFGIALDKPSRYEVVGRMLPYVEHQTSAGVRLSAITRHMLGLFHGQPGGKLWRRYLSQHAHKPGAGVEVLHNALEIVSSHGEKSQ
ncbi:MAG: tRNA dihydrouridine(20/20a) synthase DusA [Gammaproteobacteria bacterium]|nr:MAG: tRNA dihydrouridine(20/20a) synthase DusA [Gammaproteobacteria bacterium]